MTTDLMLFRCAHKSDFKEGVVIDGHAVVGVLYPSFEPKPIEKRRGGKIVREIRGPDIQPYLYDGKSVVDPGGGTSLWDRENVWGTKEWWSFVIPKGTVVPESLQIHRGHYVPRLNARHYQIEPVTERMTVDAYKGALDNLARNAVVQLCQDART